MDRTVFFTVSLFLFQWGPKSKADLFWEMKTSYNTPAPILL